MQMDQVASSASQGGRWFREAPLAKRPTTRYTHTQTHNSMFMWLNPSPPVKFRSQNTATQNTFTTTPKTPRTWIFKRTLGPGGFVWGLRQGSIRMAVHHRRRLPPGTPPPSSLANVQLNTQNHLEERFLDQAQARASYTPLFGVIRIAYPKA